MDDGGGSKTPTRIKAAMASAIRPLITRLLSNVLRTATHTIGANITTKGLGKLVADHNITDRLISAIPT